MRIDCLRLGVFIYKFARDFRRIFFSFSASRDDEYVVRFGGSASFVAQKEISLIGDAQISDSVPGCLSILRLELADSRRPASTRSLSFNSQSGPHCPVIVEITFARTTAVRESESAEYRRAAVKQSLFQFMAKFSSRGENCSNWE